MRTIKARKICRNEVITLLKSIGMVEGISLNDAEIDKTTKTLFWHGVVRSPKARNKQNYVSYYFPAFEGKYGADNDDFIKEIMVAKDVFKDNGFEVEFADEIFESETSLFHYPLTLYKIY